MTDHSKITLSQGRGSGKEGLDDWAPVGQHTEEEDKDSASQTMWVSCPFQGQTLSSSEIQDPVSQGSNLVIKIF